MSTQEMDINYQLAVLEAAIELLESDEDTSGFTEEVFAFTDYETIWNEIAELERKTKESEKRKKEMEDRTAVTEGLTREEIEEGDKEIQRLEAERLEKRAQREKKNEKDIMESAALEKKNAENARITEEKRALLKELEDLIQKAKEAVEACEREGYESYDEEEEEMEESVGEPNEEDGESETEDAFCSSFSEREDTFSDQLDTDEMGKAMEEFHKDEEQKNMEFIADFSPSGRRRLALCDELAEAGYRDDEEDDRKPLIAVEEEEEVIDIQSQDMERETAVESVEVVRMEGSDSKDSEDTTTALLLEKEGDSLDVSMSSVKEDTIPAVEEPRGCEVEGGEKDMVAAVIVKNTAGWTICQENQSTIYRHLLLSPKWYYALLLASVVLVGRGNLDRQLGLTPA